MNEIILSPDTVRLISIFAGLCAAVVFLIVLWAVLAMGSMCSRDEEEREAQHGGVGR